MYDKTKKASPVHNISKFMSLKNDLVIRVMSILEYDFCHHLEYDDDVRRFSSQPNSITYFFNNRPCRYTPDFLVSYQNNISKLFEIKHSSQLQKSAFKERYRVKRVACMQQLNLELVLVTDKQIRVFPFLNNLKMLRRYSGIHSFTELERDVLNCIYQYKVILIRDISNHLSIPPEEALVAVIRLLSTGQVKSDLYSSSFNLETLVRKV